MDETADSGNPIALGLAALWFLLAIVRLVPVSFLLGGWMLTAAVGYLLVMDRARRRWPPDESHGY